MSLLEWRCLLNGVDGGAGENEISQVETELKDDRRRSVYNETDSCLLSAFLLAHGESNVIS